MTRLRRVVNVIRFGLAAVYLAAATVVCAGEPRRMANDHIQAVFAQRDGAWRLTQLARLDGTNNNIQRGLELGYRDAYEDFRRHERWMQGKSYFDITQPKYQADLKKALHHLIVEAGVDYIKHDFKHNFTSHHLSERYAREACLDVTLALLASPVKVPKC